MDLAKKSMFFTLIGIMLVTLFIVSYSVYVQYRYNNKMDVIETRVNTMNDFINSVEKDLERALYISSFRALVSLTNYISSNGTFLEDVESAFERILLNGTIVNESVEYLMYNQTMTDWVNRIIRLGRNIDIITQINISNVTITQRDAWHVTVGINVNISIEDLKHIAQWERKSRIEALVDIDGLEDPVYTIMTNGTLMRTIRRTNFSVWDYNAFKTHFTNRTYRAYNGAPSFLMRMEGNLGASPYGIETLVDTNELKTYKDDYEFKNRSSVDYLYWGNKSDILYEIVNLTQEGYYDFRLDDEHVISYNVLCCNKTPS